MFIFRSIAFLISLLGWILGGMTFYFGLNPIEYPSQETLHLGDLLDCNASTKSYKYSQFNEETLKETKEEIGNVAPIEMFSGMLNTIESVANSVGSTTEITIEYCDVSKTTGESINSINANISKSKKYYETSTFDQFVANFNQLPFAKLSSTKIEASSTFSRSNICNKAITKSDYYLFTAFNTNALNISRIVTFRVSLVPKSNGQFYEKMVNNVITSGHYLKARFTCNG